MTDVEKVIKGLESCPHITRDCPQDCPYERMAFCLAHLHHDALELLKEHQPKETSWIHRKDMDFKDKLGCNHINGMCENCGLICDFKDGHTAQYKYCPQCGGKAVQWKDCEQE